MTSTYELEELTLIEAEEDDGINWDEDETPTVLELVEDE
jgi:hypothetical protein